ncbi:MAG: S41 family peptidase [Planctomycetota bacterium]
MRIIVWSCVALSVFVSGQAAQAQESTQSATSAVEGEPQLNSPAAAYRESVAKQLMELCDLVMERHVDPPAKQQLLLTVLKTAWSKRKAEAQAGDAAFEDPRIRRLGRNVSGLASDAEFTRSLVECFDDIELSEKDDTLLVDQLMQSVLFAAPGGGQVSKASGLEVERQLAENRYVGIGIALAQNDGLPLISKCFYNGPGYRLGVRTNDVILEIEGNRTSGKTLAEIVDVLRGEKGTDVTLLLRNPSDSVEREITVTRDVTFIPTVAGIRADQNGRWIHRLDTEPHFAHLHIERFGPSTVHELKKLAGELASGDKPLDGIILDLSRGGGPLKDVVMVADQFLETGAIGAAVFPDRVQDYQAQPGSLFKGVPMVIIVAPTSSASSVLLATALRDNDRATVVGSPTNGLSYIRGAFSLSTGDQVVFPTGFIRRANGDLMAPRTRSGVPNPIQEQRQAAGAILVNTSYLVPDHVVTNTPANARRSQPTSHPEKSPVMSKAIAVLKASVSDQKKAVAGSASDTTGGDS